MAARTWRGAGVEVLVISLGVLLALGADEVRREIDRRSRERVLLQDLKAEFEANLAELKLVGAQHGAAAGSARRLIEVGNGAPAPKDSVRVWMRTALTSGNRFDARTGTLDAYLSNPEAGLLRNPQLRAALADWPRRVDELWQQEDRIREFADRDARQFLLQAGDPLSLYVNFRPPGSPLSVPEPGNFASRYRTGDEMYELASSTWLQNLAATRVYLMRATLRKHRRLLEAHEDVLAMISADLND